MVLVQYVDARGFAFFTNLGSRKARDLDARPGGRAVLSLAHARAAGAHRRRRRAGGGGRGGLLLRDATAREPDRGLGVAAERAARVARLRSRRAWPTGRAEFQGRDVPRPPFWSGFRARARSHRVLDGRHRAPASSRIVRTRRRRTPPGARGSSFHDADTGTGTTAPVPPHPRRVWIDRSCSKDRSRARAKR